MNVSLPGGAAIGTVQVRDPGVVPGVQIGDVALMSATTAGRVPTTIDTDFALGERNRGVRRPALVAVAVGEKPSTIRPLTL